jgi:hypothetical protein
MGEKIGTLILCACVLTIAVVLFIGKVAPAINTKGDTVITEINGVSTNTVKP